MINSREATSIIGQLEKDGHEEDADSFRTVDWYIDSWVMCDPDRLTDDAVVFREKLCKLVDRWHSDMITFNACIED